MNPISFSTIFEKKKAEHASVAEAGAAEHAKNRPALEKQLKLKLEAIEKTSGELKQLQGLNKRLTSYKYDAGRILSELRLGFPKHGTWVSYLEGDLSPRMGITRRTAYNYMQKFKDLGDDASLVKAAVAADLDINSPVTVTVLRAAKKANPTAPAPEVAKLAKSTIDEEKEVTDALQKSTDKDLNELRKQFGHNKGTVFGHNNLGYTVTLRNVQVDEIDINKDALLFVRLTAEQLRTIKTEVDWVQADTMTVDGIRKLLKSVGYTAAAKPELANRKAKGASVN